MLFDKIPENGYLVVTDRTLFHAAQAGQPEDRGFMHSHYCEDEPKVVFTITDVREKIAGPVFHLGTFDPDRVPFVKDQLVVQAVQPERRFFRSRVHVAGHLIGIAVERLVANGVLDGIRNFKAVHYRPHWIVEFEGLLERGNKHAQQQINQEVNEMVKKDARLHLRYWSIDKGHEKGASMRSFESGPASKQVSRFVEIDGIGAYACSGTFVSKTGTVGRVKVVSIHLHKKKDVTRMWYGIEREAP